MSIYEDIERFQAEAQKSVLMDAPGFTAHFRMDPFGSLVERYFEGEAVWTPDPRAFLNAWEEHGNAGLGGFVGSARRTLEVQALYQRWLELKDRVPKEDFSMGVCQVLPALPLEVLEEAKRRAKARKG